MTIISDTTALILLAKVELLEIFTQKNKVIIPKIVYQEALAGKQKGRKDAFIIEKLVNEKRISVEIAKDNIKDHIEKLFNIKKGELEVISLAYKTEYTVLSDDMKCIRATRALNLNLITSLGVIVALENNRTINKKKALEAIDELQEYGWYTNEIIRTYKEALQ